MSVERQPNSPVLVLLPEDGSDPSEVAIPWAIFRGAGLEVVFATRSGRRSQPDTLSFRSPLLLVSRPMGERRRMYERMLVAPEFASPSTFADALERQTFGALFVPGGEGPGMLPFLEDEQAQAIVRQFFCEDLPRAFLCHGGLLAARTRREGHSVIAGRRVTTVPKLAELLGVAAFLLSGRPRVYGALGGNWAADEMSAAAGAGNFVPPRFTLRFRSEHDRGAVVVSGREVYGGGPWDAAATASALLEVLARETVVGDGSG